MSDDKKPREWTLAYSAGACNYGVPEDIVLQRDTGPQLKRGEKACVIEKSAYDSLAERLKVAEAERLHFWKICVERAEQVDTLNTELLNTNELSSKLVEENAALKVEVDMKEYELFVHEERANKFLDETVALEDALKIEREICGVLREALEELHKKLTPKIPRMDGKESWTIQQKFIDKVTSEALAREKEMRK